MKAIFHFFCYYIFMAKQKKKHSTLRFIVGLIVFLTTISILGIYLIKDRLLQVEYAPSSLSLSSDSLNNPYCGWYHTYNYTIKEDSTLDTSLIEAAQVLDAGTQLCLLDVNINAYSNIDITPHAASELKAILSAWSNSGKQIILRIDYGNAATGTLAEPMDISKVYLHMEQLAPIISEYAPLIYSVQGAFIGNNGLYQGSMYNTEENIIDLTKYIGSLLEYGTYLSVTDPNMYMKVNNIKRMPAALTSDNPLQKQNINSMPFRLGISQYNITSDNSQATLSSLAAISTWAPIGGAVGNDSNLYDLTTAITTLQGYHVSYLSADENASVLSQWKNVSYRGDDAFSGITGYDYVTTHLGYRYVVNSTNLSFDPLRDDTGKLNVEFENIGFANTLHNFEVSLVLKNVDTEELIKIPLDTNTSSWYPNQPVSVTADLNLRDYTKGNFNIYVIIIDPTTGSIIKLGNTMPLSTNGYQIATMKCGIS